MWDPKTHFFYSLDRDSDQRIPVRTLQGFLTLTCGAASPEQAACLARQLQDPKQWWPEYPVTTTAMNEPTFDPKGFWRGDMWPPTNYLITLGLNRYGYYDMARELTDKMLQLVEKHDGRSFERYDGTRGIPLGVPDYCWGVTIWSMIVHNVYGVQEDYQTIVVPPHAKGRRLKLGKLELSYPSDTALKVRSAFEREFRIVFRSQSGEIKVRCNGESVKVLHTDVRAPKVEFLALPHKTYIISME
jgi:glycogen debranching enzyme